MTLTWLYAVVPADAVPAAVPSGVADAPVRLVTGDGLAAVTSPVPLEQPVQEKLTDPAWLEQAARGHHRVVQACFEAAPTVPFRLATVLHDEQRVRELLATHAERLAATLHQVAGREEWGVQAKAATRRSAGPAPRSGADYLRQRRAELARASADRRRAVAAADDLHGALADLAEAAYRRPVAADDRRGLLLDAAYLVAREERAGFLESVRRLEADRPELRLRVTGPWPPYSFVDLEREPA